MSKNLTIRHSWRASQITATCKDLFFYIMHLYIDHMTLLFKNETMVVVLWKRSHTESSLDCDDEGFELSI